MTAVVGFIGKKVYENIEDFVVEKPIHSIITSIVVKALAFLAKYINIYLAVAIFLSSFVFEFAIFTNLDDFLQTLAEKVNIQIAKIKKDPEKEGFHEGKIVRQRVERVADEVKSDMETFGKRTKGFFQGLFGERNGK